MKWFVLYFLFTSLWTVFTGWNKGNLCKTNASPSKLGRLSRYLSCCQFAYQIPHNAFFEKLLVYLSSEHLLSYEPFYHKKEKRHVAGYIICFKDEIVVSFRGTIIDGKIRSELWNNINNGIVRKQYTEDLSIGIHAGIYHEYLQIQESFLEKWQERKEEKGDNRPITFTGHSLGGMCQIAALEVYTLSDSFIRDRIRCITFGAYKIFDDSHIFHNLGMENIRVRFKNDAVALYPISSKFKNAHTHEIIFYHKRRIEHRICYYKRFANCIPALENNNNNI